MVSSEESAASNSSHGNPGSASVVSFSDNDGHLSGAFASAAASASVDEYLRSLTVENVRKAMIASAYNALKVVPNAFLHPGPFLRATKVKELFRRLMKWNVATSHISVKFSGDVKHSIAKEGIDCRYYGGGPEWNKNSCFWDSIIVSCLFLNAGFSYLDRGASPSDWENELTSIQRAFLDLLRMDWNFFDKKTGIAQRRLFLGLLDRERATQTQGPTAERGEFDSVAACWNEISPPFHQSSLRTHTRIKPCPCRNQDDLKINPETDIQYITPPLRPTDKEGVTVADLLQRWSNFLLPHAGCQQNGSKQESHVIHGNLPLRMVLQVTDGKLLDHTSQNISFSYNRIAPGSDQETQERATYRWLGSVYTTEQHVRVCWNDSAPDSKTVQQLRVYDGLQANGAIIGGVPVCNGSEPIPQLWAQISPPLLFYEQVVQPSPLVLEAARSAIAEVSSTQHDRSVYVPGIVSTTPGAECAVTADCLLPRQLANAVLAVEGHQFEHDKSASRLIASTLPPADPKTGTKRRLTRSSSRSETWPNGLSGGQGTKRSKRSK